jgi:hypothetical protein
MHPLAQVMTRTMLTVGTLTLLISGVSFAAAVPYKGSLDFNFQAYNECNNELVDFRGQLTYNGTVVQNGNRFQSTQHAQIVGSGTGPISGRTYTYQALTTHQLTSKTGSGNQALRYLYQTMLRTSGPDSSAYRLTLNYVAIFDEQFNIVEIKKDSFL